MAISAGCYSCPQVNEARIKASESAIKAEKAAKIQASEKAYKALDSLTEENKAYELRPIDHGKYLLKLAENPIKEKSNIVKVANVAAKGTELSQSRPNSHTSTLTDSLTDKESSVGEETEEIKGIPCSSVPEKIFVV